jgi:hypothetical protein
MPWLLGGLVLVIVAALMWGILRMGAPERLHVSGLLPLRGDLYAVYRPLAQEIEAHATILGITLNDAFGEREADRQEMAWHIVRLAVGEWDRLTELVVGLQDLLGKFLSTTSGIVPVRRVTASRYKSRAVVESVGLFELLDQILFSSKRRFALQLRLLHRTSLLLRKEFRNICHEGERTLDSSEELWNRIDLYFHDFDLIAKETLLAFRTVLTCQSRKGVEELALELRGLLERGVRVSVSSTDQ